MLIANEVIKPSKLLNWQLDELIFMHLFVWLFLCWSMDNIVLHETGPWHKKRLRTTVVLFFVILWILVRFFWNLWILLASALQIGSAHWLGGMALLC